MKKWIALGRAPLGRDLLLHRARQGCEHGRVGVQLQPLFRRRLRPGIARAGEQAFHQFGAVVHPLGWDEIGEVLPRAGLLVNATSLGMRGQPALKLDVGLLSPRAIVADLVYVPLETALLKAARARGLKTADGLGMLLHQAVRGFELWFGQRPQVTPELRALVAADLLRV